MSDLVEGVFERSIANDPTPLRERTTWSILDEIRDGCDAVRMEQLATEIMWRCNAYEGDRA